MSRIANTRFSALDLAPIRDDGTPAQALHNALALARHVEGLGFQRFWVAEHHNMDGIASAATACCSATWPPTPRASVSVPVG